MLRRTPFIAALVLGLACGDSGGSTGTGGAASSPGPLVDNTKWVPTSDGERFFGPPPEGAICELDPIDCPQFPWPNGECVTLEPGCVASFVPECRDNLAVMSVYTRMPNPTEPLCNWLTLEQPSLRDIREGDEVEIRMFHSELNAPAPGEARMMLAIGDELAFKHEVFIPFAESRFPSAKWTAPRDYPAGTQLLYHVDNHGKNEYMLIEVNILDPLENR